MSTCRATLLVPVAASASSIFASSLLTATLVIVLSSHASLVECYPTSPVDKDNPPDHQGPAHTSGLPDNGASGLHRAGGATGCPTFEATFLASNVPWRELPPLPLLQARGGALDKNTAQYASFLELANYGEREMGPNRLSVDSDDKERYSRLLGMAGESEDGRNARVLVCEGALVMRTAVRWRQHQEALVLVEERNVSNCV